jgi:hypothetical protein
MGFIFIILAIWWGVLAFLNRSDKPEHNYCMLMCMLNLVLANIVVR